MCSWGSLRARCLSHLLTFVPHARPITKVLLEVTLCTLRKLSERASKVPRVWVKLKKYEFSLFSLHRSEHVPDHSVFHNIVLEDFRKRRLLLINVAFRSVRGSGIAGSMVQLTLLLLLLFLISLWWWSESLPLSRSPRIPRGGCGHA